MLTASVVTRASEFSKIRDEWRDLIAQSHSATVFDTYEWQFNWWATLGCRKPGARLAIITLRTDDGRLVGVLPFFSRISFVWRFRTLSFIGEGNSDYMDVIAADGFENQVCDSFYRFVASMREWSHCDLREIRDGGVLKQYSTKPIVGDVRVSEMKMEECPYFEFPAIDDPELRWTTFLARYSKKTRDNIKYYDRALDRVYAVERRLVDAPEEVDKVLTSLFILHKRRWNQRWLPGVFYNAAIRQFHRQAAADLLSAGILRLHYILLDDLIESVLYCFHLNRVTYYYQSGFEPELSKLSLGSVSTWIAAKKAADENSLRFDFLRGNEPYKRNWTRGQSAWTSRWIVSRRNYALHGFLTVSSTIAINIEQRLKEWMNQRRSLGGEEEKVKEEK